ncbi:UNVERIFIED_CONTAM: hypothetical protein O8I53_11500 [Campylobacter lari]
MVPKPDSQKTSNQYLINLVKNDNLTLFSQAFVNLVLSPKRNEELIINDNVVPISLTGFKYKIKPTDKKLKIQVKVYDLVNNNNVAEINKNNFHIFTITEDLFKQTEITSVYDEIDFKLHN